MKIKTINDNFIEGLNNNLFMKVGRIEDGHLMYESFVLQSQRISIWHMS